MLCKRTKSLVALIDPEEEAPTEGFFTVVKLEIFC